MHIHNTSEQFGVQYLTTVSVVLCCGCQPPGLNKDNQHISPVLSLCTDHCPFTLWMLISFDKVIQSNNIWVGLQLVILRLDFSHTDRLPAYRQTHSNVTGRQFLDYDRNVKASCTHAPWFCTFICKHLFNNTVYFLPWERHQFLLGISSQVIQKLLRRFTQNHKFELHGGPKRKKSYHECWDHSACISWQALPSTQPNLSTWVCEKFNPLIV